MQNEQTKTENITTQSPSVVLQPEGKKRKDWIPIVIFIIILVSLYFTFPRSGFINLFIALSIPVSITYLLTRNAYREVTRFKIMVRSTFYPLLFVLDIIVFFILLSLLMPKESHEGLAAFGLSIMIVLGEILFTILAIISYELFLKYKK